ERQLTIETRAARFLCLRASVVGSRLMLLSKSRAEISGNGAATPPLQGGEYTARNPRLKSFVTKAKMIVMIQRTAVLGAGTMGAQIAAHLANAGVSVLLLDVTTEQAKAGLRGLEKSSPPA